VQGSDGFRADGAVFDEDNLVSHAGLVPLLALAERTGLSRLLGEHVRFTCERIKSGAANSTPKLTSIIAGMACGADSIDDLDVIRAGAMTRVFSGVYAPATLGIFLREFTHGHTRQLAAVLRRHLVALAEQTRVLDGIADRCFIDIDSLLRPVYGHAKQGASFGHTKISGKTVLRRGLSPLAVTIGTETAAPVLAGVRLRAGRVASSRGAASMVTEAINTTTAAGATRNTFWSAATPPTAPARSWPRSSTPVPCSRSRSPATLPSMPRSPPSPTSSTPRCTTPVPWPTRTPVN
jgi:hypothetical protein